MKPLHTASLLLSLAALAGCRTDPCGDRRATLPASLAPAGAALDGASVCHAFGDRATLMYWGGADKLNEVTVRAIARLNADAWAQRPPSPYADPQHPVYSFERGDEVISLRFSRTQTPRLGAKLLTDSVTVTASHSVANRRALR